VEYTEQSGIAFDSTAMAVVSGSRVFRSGTQGVRAEIVDSLLVRGTTIEEPGRNGVVALGYGLSDLDSVIVMRSGSHGFRGDSGGTAIVTNSEFHDVNFSVIWPEADTILVDNVLANGAGNFGVVTQLTNVVIVDNSEFSDMGVVGVGDFGTGSGYVSVTNSVFRNSRFNSIWVHSDSLLVQNDSMIGVPEGTAIVHEFPTNSVMLDSITFVSPTRPSWTIIRDNYIQDPAWQGVWTFDVSYVDIGNNTVTGANPNDPFTWALEVVLADSTMIDSNSVTNTYGGGIYTSESDFVYSRGNTVTNAFMGIGPFDEPRAVNVEAAVESHIVANTVVSDRGEGIFVGADTAVVDSNVARGIDSAIRIGDGPDSTGFWGSLTGNQIVGLGVPLIVSVSDTMSTAIVENNVIDSAGTFGLIVQAAMNSATIRGNTVSMRDSASSFAIGYSGGNVLVENNTFNCNGNRSGAIQIWGGGVWQNNVFNGCDSGTWSGPGNLATFPAQFDDTLVVTNNTFTTDTTLLGGVFGMGNNQQVADFTNNTMTGVPLVAIVGSTDPLFPTFLARVDGNIISGSPTDAVFVADVDTALVRNNTVSGTLATSEVAVEVGSRIHTVVSNNSVTGALAGGVFVNGPSAAVVDSNVITDNVGTGLGFNTVVTAFKNTIRRNTTGIEDFWGGATVDSSNVDSNTVFGYRNNSGVNSNATNIWWGDALGPRCVTGCDTLSVGDSVSTFVTFTPFAAATVPGTPAGTAMPSARWLARRPDSSGQARRFEFPSFATPEIVAEVPAPRGFAARNMFSETVARLPAPAQLLQHRRRAER
ncbi:MAG: right-handed parallel beta-helix repeat-containing protein, partial [Gemmatimonadales bacterium]